MVAISTDGPIDKDTSVSSLIILHLWQWHFNVSCNTSI